MLTGNSRIDSSTAELIVGSDEAGRGNWAGPLVTAAVCVPRGWVPPKGLTDSKKLSEKQRFALREALLRDKAVGWRVIQSHPDVIDRIGVHQANIADHLAAHGDLVYLDGVIGATALHVADGNLPLGEGIVSLPKADALVMAVSAASIFAKTALDQYMREMDRVYPGYGFAQNKGYGTPAHIEGLSRIGPCPIHRRSFAPVREAMKGSTAQDSLTLMDELSQD